MRRIAPHKITAIILAVMVAASVPAASQEAQKRVGEINSFATLAGVFNLGQGAVRVVAVVAPRRPDTMDKLSFLCELMSSMPSNRLRAYVILLPDPEHAAELSTFTLAARLTSVCPDPRITYLWDPERQSMAAWKPALSEADPHAAFFVYDTNATLGEESTPPVAWQHWNDEAASAARTKKDFAASVKILLDVIEERVRTENTGTDE